MKPRFTLFITLLFLFIASNYSKAQVGIGTTTPDGSALLDLTSTAKGALVPRMTQAQRTGIGSPATGLLVYQTDASNGFWYFDGTQWQLLGTIYAWALTGNSGTVDGTNFLGNTDDVALTLRVNNTASARIGNSTEGNTMLGYSSGSTNSFNGSTFIGFNAGLNNGSSASNCAMGWSALTTNSSGFNNSAVGYASMKATLTGFDNAALGMSSLYSNVGGSENTAVGSNSLYSNTVGNGNSAVGQKSLYNNISGTYNSALGVNCLYGGTTGNRNVAEGYTALNGVTSANNNTGLGYAAGSTIATGANNTFLGSNADAASGALTNATAIGYNAKVNSSNTMVLGSTTSNVVKIGISVAAPTNDLSFDGTAARTVWMERNTNAGTVGFNLTLQSGAASGGTNLAGGDLDLSSGTSTGTGTSNIVFKTAPVGASGTADNAPTTKMTISGYGVQVSGSVVGSYRVTSGTQTLTSTDYVVVNNGGAGATWTLPTTNIPTGRIVIIANEASAGVLTISAGFYTSSGAIVTTIANGASAQLIYDGTNWRKFN